MDFVKYPKIGQYRNVVKEVSDYCEYHNEELPTITFHGTVKLHGTNAGISFDPSTNELQAQSRNRVITPESDNAGFAFFVESNKEELIEWFKSQHFDEVVTVFGEWCGGNIQKGVALSQLSKMFVVFDIKVGDYYYLPYEVVLVDMPLNVKSVYDFPTYSVDVDFSNPEGCVGTLQEITVGVEEECPVGKFFGVSGVGEGVVWKSSGTMPRQVFKVKGEKHSVTKVKKLTSSSVENMEGIKEFVQYALTEQRLLQGIGEVFGDQTPDISNLGDFIKWVKGDIFSEEMDTLISSGIEPKHVVKSLSSETVKWFKTQYC